LVTVKYSLIRLITLYVSVPAKLMLKHYKNSSGV
jgi:hypothetical protein